MTLLDADDCRDVPFGLVGAAVRRGERGFLDGGEANAENPGKGQECTAARRSATKASTLAAVVSHEHMKRTPVAPTKL
jgi:hypothetical protein